MVVLKYKSTLYSSRRIAQARKCLFSINMHNYLNGETFEFCSYFQLAHELVSQFLPLGHYDVCMGVRVEVQQYQ